MFFHFWPVGFVALLMTIGSSPADAADPKVHEGLIVSAGDGKLVMTDATGKSHTHTITDAAKITVNGKPGKLADLKPGVRIRVMSDGAGKVISVATVDDEKLIRRHSVRDAIPSADRQMTIVP